MLKSISQFNLKIIQICIFILALASPRAFSQTESFYFPFRIEQEVYSQEDIYNSLKRIKYFNCMMFNNSFTKNFISFDRYSEKKVRKELDQLIKRKKIILPNRYKTFFKKLITFTKLAKYIGSQKIEISKDLQADLIQTDKVNKCGGLGFGEEGLVKWFENYVKVEMYFKSRFQLTAFIASDREIKNLREQNKSLSIKAAKELLQESKLKASVNIFLISIDKQYEHEVFW